MSDKAIKIVVTFEARPDGGLRAWSEDVPGLVLSHMDIDGVLEDVKTAIEVILSSRLNADIQVQPLVNVREALEANGIVKPAASYVGSKEYVAYCH